MRIFSVTLGIIVLDQLSKLLVQEFMNQGQSIKILESFLYLTYLENPGAAFGILPYRTTLFILVTIAVMVFIFYYLRKLPSHYRLMRLGLTFMLAGAAGNLIDRLRIGYVIDFINLNFWPPVFNVADVAIVIGIIVFVYSFWQKELVWQD